MKKIFICMSVIAFTFLFFTFKPYALEEKVIGISIDSNYVESNVLAPEVITSTTSTQGYIPIDYANKEEVSNEDLIFGNDDRILLTDAQYTQFPYRCVCRIYTAYDENGDGVVENYGYYGTGCLVGPKTILTCSHLMYNSDYGWPMYIEVQIGAHVDSVTEQYVTTAVYTSWNYLTVGTVYNTGDASDDWALLDMNDSIGSTYGYFSVSTNLSFFNSVKLYGYHGDLNGNMAYGYGLVTFLETYKFRHNCDAIAGSSGAPITYGDTTIVGVHSRGYNAYEDQAYRISSYMVTWVNERLSL